MQSIFKNLHWTELYIIEQARQARAGREQQSKKGTPLPGEATPQLGQD